MKRQTLQTVGLYIALGASMIGGQSVLANELQQASKRLCDHFKKCMLSEMAAQEESVPPSMQAVLDNMTKELCSSVMDITQISGKHDLEKSAIACLDSMSNTSCKAMEDDVETPACLDYQKQAEKYFPESS